ncbi:hypothetical protein DL770_002468 [Monosporascus sp. CRB-9-2]|nr:hypothetical protein DL770_002468 [Monosporascus sp. CRB-9-2]
MPIFQQDLDRRGSAGGPGTEAATDTEDGDGLSIPMPSPHEQLRRERAPQEDHSLPRRFSEESLRTEFCEGPVPESPASKTSEHERAAPCSDRAELIERLKKGESPTWVPNRFLRTPSPREEKASNYRSLTSHDQFDSIWNQSPVTTTRSPNQTSNSPSLLPPPTITPEKGEPASEDESTLQHGLNIERPRSALHSGDFTQADCPRDGSSGEEDRRAIHQNTLSDGGHPWLATSPPRDFTPFRFERRDPPVRPTVTTSSLSSLSSSVSSSFVYMPPTSPLVQSESNDDLELTSPMDGIDISSSVPRNSRRHTVMSSHSAFGFSPSPIPRQPPSLRQERMVPYQAHQPRRSLISTPNFSMMVSSPQTPGFLRSRRPSHSSEVSPVQHASMVGSYEESILRGRMSTTPSKPLEFLAQIGVLGLGKCKSSLRCPPHVTLPFPAVFYSYPSSSNGPFKMEDGPSPYVGQIDLENGLPNQDEEARSRRKKQSRASERKRAGDDGRDGNDSPAATSDRESRRTQRHKRRSSSSRAPPGGSYRIPEKGQIQIIIKNPNKTAVKLFLVPYDLAGMEPGSKTFIRQRSYSTGPIIENMPQLKGDGQADRPILRYLVHLHICCPSRGRYYLYKSIRVVFANRVPDGKEKLRNEVTLPEPRYTSYKPIRVMHPPASGGTGPGASLVAEKALRRRSSGLYFGGSNLAAEAIEGLHPPSVPTHSYSFNFGGGDNVPVEPIPFKLSSSGRPGRANIAEDNNGSGSNGGAPPAGPLSPGSSSSQATISRPTTQDSSNNDNDNASGLGSAGGGFFFDGQIDRYDKLSKGDVGYGGNAFSGLRANGSPGVAESLLSQRLRTLGVEGATTAQQLEQPTPGDGGGRGKMSDED